jgi:hypothetical protein
MTVERHHYNALGAKAKAQYNREYTQGLSTMTLVLMVRPIRTLGMC